MAVIKKPDTISEDLVNDYRQVFAANLVAVIMYGSILTPDYKPGKSDVNIVIVLNDDSIAEIVKSVSVFRKWSHYRITVPFYMSRKFIASALDAYPVEFLDICLNYRVLFGEDVFKTIFIDNNCLRLQCERELRGHAIHLRSAYVTAGGRNKVLTELLEVSIKKLLPVFKALLTLRGLPVPAHRGNIVSAVEQAFIPASTILMEVFDAVYNKSLKRSYADLYNFYTKGIDTLINSIDAQFNERVNV